MFRITIKDQLNNISNAAEFATEAEVNEWYEYNLDFFPKPHSFEIISLADEKKEKLRIQESKEAVLLGNDLMIQIRATNRRKIKTGLWTEEKFNALLVSPVAAKIERALWNGSLQTAAYLLTSMSDFYSDIEIQKFISQIQTHETKWTTLI